jgi:excinuclease ABC subunit A
MSVDELVIKGAKQNNLKNINLRLPHDKVIAVTGVSGSGKSSLAFETIFAEGQWRFIESLSTYARLFLEKLDRPQVDLIENIRPAIALEQRNPVRGSRSTVGTLTELYDLFRLLYSKVATPYCPRCGEEIRKWDPSSSTAEMLRNYEGRKAMIIFESPNKAADLIKRGFLRVFSEGRIMEIESIETSPPYDVVLDRLVIRDEPRLSDSVEMAFREGGGKIKIAIIKGPVLRFSSINACESCGLELPDPTPLLFSFNHPVGACPVCKGFGNILRYDEELIIPDGYLSLTEGAVDPFEKPAASWWKDQMLSGAEASGIDVNVPYMKLPKKHRDILFRGDRNFHGIDDFFDDLESKRYKLHVRVFLSRYRKGVKCKDCGGRRLSPEALAYKISGHDIVELSEFPISEVIKLFEDIDISPFQKDVAKEPLRQIGLKLGFLQRVGLGYLTLSREARTLSGGEYQRVNLSNQLASRLTGTMYVLDEPTVGLHKRDTDRVSEIMSEISSMGNTIVVVEHDRDIIEPSDWVVELGPGGGQRGGRVVFSGPMDEFVKKADTVTSRYLRGENFITDSRKRRMPKGNVVLKGASGNNLRDIDFKVPINTLTVVSGVSGSGKSTLVVDTLYEALIKKLRLGVGARLHYKDIKGHDSLKAVKLIDQTPIGRSPRSNPVTYLKVFDHIRRIFAGEPEARARGYGPGFFSFNVPGGRCGTCNGEGYQKVEMYFFEDLYIKCEECGGRRYSPEALRVKHFGKGIDEVLEMTVDDAVGFFQEDRAICSRLSLMKDIGLGYLRLGQPATTLSGGEAQRLKICSELGSGKIRDVLYILDEPTVGLHAKDVQELLGVLDRLVDAGNTVLLIEHNLDVIRSADWIVDLGPEGGDRGGEIVFEGAPEKIVECKRSYTGRYLKN